MNNDAKVGAFVLAGMVLLGVTIFLLGDVSFEKRYPLFVGFKEVSGLPDRGTVKLSGVEVGNVKTITLDGARVRVELAVREGVEIYKDSVFRIGSTSVIGSKFLEISQGDPSSGVLQAGDSAVGEESVPLERAVTQALAQVQKVLGEVSDEGRLGRNINASVENIRELTITLNELVSELKPSLTATAKNVEVASGRMDAVLAKAERVAEQAAEVLAKVNTSTAGTVGALLGDTEMKDDVKETVKSLKLTAADAKQVFGRFRDLKVYWYYNNRWEPSAKNARGDVALKIYPRPDRYYHLGVSNLGSDKDIRRALDYEEKNRIDARLGWTKKNLDFQVGLIRGAGGVEVEYSPVPKIWAFANAADFLRNRTIRGKLFDHPRYDAGVRWQAHRLLSVGVRVNDIVEAPRFQTDTRIVFEDKDISYFLGLVTLGASSAGGN